MTYKKLSAYILMAVLFIQLNYWTFSAVDYGSSIIGIIFITVFEALLIAMLLEDEKK